jgi:hypothetical protein
VLRSRLLLLPAGLVVACTLAYPMDDFRGRTVTTPTGAFDAGPDARETCGTSVPARPSSSDGPDGPDLVFGIREMEVGNDLTKLNFDRKNLDGLCSCPASLACIPPANQQPYCDKSIGVDNAGGALIETIYKLSAARKSLTDGFKIGSSTLAVRVQGYNGTPDDPLVQVSLLPVVGSGTAPAWDGTDVRAPNEYWLVNSAPIVPKIFDINAYVRGGVLVASTSGPVPFGDLIVETIDFHLTAKLAGNTLAEGNLLFRSTGSEVLRAFGRFPDPNVDGGVCAGNSFELLKAQVCNNRDLPSDPKKDGQDTPCSALSFTFRFTAMKVALGATVLEPPTLKDCAPSVALECPP